MAAHSVTQSTLTKAFRKTSTKLYRTYTRRVLEYRKLEDIPDEDIIPSHRENLIPLDVAVGYGAAQITDGGYEARTETPDLAEGSFVFNHTNSRFGISLRAHAFDRAARTGHVIQQLKLKSIKCIEAVMRKFAYMTYGYSTGVVALVSGDPASSATPTLTLKDAFGLSFADNAAYLAAMFPEGEGVALIRAGALIGIGVVTDVSASTPSITVNFGTAVDAADGDSIVYANAVTGNTLDETDWNKWHVGILDILTSSSVHGLATADAAAWAPALYDTNGGSFGFLKRKQMAQALENKGDTTLKRLIVSNGVENDMEAKERAALQWGSSSEMNLDGNVTISGVSKETTRFVPPTFAIGIGSDAWGKKMLTDKPDENDVIDVGKLHKSEDRSVLKGGVDVIGAVICRSRSRFAAFGNLNEQGV